MFLKPVKTRLLEALRGVPRDGYFMLLAILVAGVIGIFLSERVDFRVVKEGNWDSARYVAWAQDFHKYVISDGVRPYWVERVLPSGIVNLAMIALNLPREETLVMTVFQVYNLVLLLLCACLWVLMSHGFPRGERWLGFLALFGNYAVLKYNQYMPALTDVTALTLGMLMLFFFLRRRPAGLLMTAVLGAFTWPTALAFGLLLYLLPKQEKSGIRPSPRFAASIAALVCLVVLFGIIFVYFVRQIPPRYNGAPVLHSLVLVSSLLALSFVFYCLFSILNADYLWRWASLRQALVPTRLLVGLGVFLCCRAIISYLVNPESPDNLARLAEYSQVADPPSFLRWLPPRLCFFFGGTVILSSITKPLIFMLSHILWYGPILFLTIFAWRAFCRSVQQHGIGITVFVAANLFLGLCPESRQLTIAFPFFVYYTVKAIGDRVLRPGFYWAFGLTSLLLSKVWYEVNAEPLAGKYLDFPFQRLMMSQGLFMSVETYIVQGVAMLLAGVLLYALYTMRTNACNTGLGAVGRLPPGP